MDYAAIGKRIRAYRKKIDLSCALGVWTDDLIFEQAAPSLADCKAGGCSLAVFAL